MSKIWVPLELDTYVDANGEVKIYGVSIVDKSNDPYAGMLVDADSQFAALAASARAERHESELDAL